MTRIDFYFNVENKFRQAAELAQVALKKQRRLFMLTSDADAALQLETTLWSHPPTGFLPHCRGDHPLAQETPIVIDWRDQPPPQDDILVNLSALRPPHFSRFKGLIELVGLDEDDRLAARERYRYYRDRGYDLHTHDQAEERA